MPPLSTHFRFAILIKPGLDILSHAGSFLLGTTTPDAFEPDNEDSFSRYHFRITSGRIDLGDFLNCTNFIHLPADSAAWYFACGYFCHLWLDIFYRDHADSISIKRPAGMADGDLRSLVRKETEILNAPFVLEAGNLFIPPPANLLLPPGLEFVEYERCVSLFNDVIKQSREWLVHGCEFKSIDPSEYAAFLKNASQLFVNDLEMAAEKGPG